MIGGQVVTVYWSGITNPGPKDQIGLYRTADTLPQSNRLEPPVFTGGLSSGFANVVVPNDVLLTGTSSDTFEFILYHADASTATPVFVTQNHTFSVVANTVALVAPTPVPTAPPPLAKPRDVKPPSSAGSKATTGGSKSAAAAPAPSPTRVGSAGPGAPAPPPGPAPTPVAGNDTFAAGYTVGKLPAKLTQSTAAAGTEAGEQLVCGGVPFGKTVWYRVTPAMGTLTVDTYGSDFDTVLAVYTAAGSPAALANLQLLSYDDDAGSQRSRVTILARPFTTYYVQAGGLADPNPSGGGTLGPTDAGTLVVRFYATPAEPNDNFASAIMLPTGVSTTLRALNGGADVEAGEPMTSGGTSLFCDTAQVRRTLWYKIQPPANSVVTLDTFGSDFDTVLAVYTGNAVNALTLQGCNDDALSTTQSQVSFSASVGVTYYVQVGGYGGDAGTLVVNFP